MPYCRLWYCFIACTIFFHICQVLTPNTTLIPASEKYDTEYLVPVIRDVIRNSPTKEFIFITSREIRADVSEALSKEAMSAVNLDLKAIDEEQLKDLNNANKKDNIQPTFIILSYVNDPDVLSVSRTIRTVDYFNALILFYWNSNGILSESLYNSYFVRYPKVGKFDFYEVCMFCDKGNDDLQLITKRNSKTGFSNGYRKPQSFKQNFFGKVLKFDCINKDIFSLSPGLTIFSINKALGFTLQLIEKSPREVQNTLLSKTTDFSGCFHLLSYARYQWAEIGYMYGMSNLIMISVKPRKGFRWYSFVKPLSPEVWLWTFLSIPPAAFGLYVLFKIDPRTTDRTLGDCLWDIIQITLWDDINISGPSIGLIIHLSSYMLTTFTLIAAYIGLVTAYMVDAPYLWPPMDTLEQFQLGTMKYVVRRGLFEDKYFDDDPIMKPRKVYAPFDKTKSYNYNFDRTPLQMLLDNPTELVVINTGMQGGIYDFFVDDEGKHDFHFSKNGITFMLYTFLFRKDTLWVEGFNRKLTRIWDTGIVKYIEKTMDLAIVMKGIKNAKKQKRFAKPPPSDKIQLIHVAGGFVIMGIGYFCSFVSALVEFVMSKVAKA